MRRGCIVALAIAVLACPAGAADLAPLLPNPILEPDSRWAFDGFALAPPQDKDWYSLLKTRDRAVLVKALADDDRGFFVVVLAERAERRLESADAFLAYVRARRAKASDARGVESLAYEEALDSDAIPWCTRYRVRAAEAVPWYAPARSTEVVGRACLHPGAADYVIDTSYSMRGARSAEDRTWRETGDAVLASVRLAPLTERAVATQTIAELQSLAEGGDATAALQLAGMFERGRGVGADAAEAERWYRVAAGLGEMDALYNLGALFERGVGRARDAGEAVKWFRRAADQRDAQAQLNLGLIYYKGDGLPRDPAIARGWFQLAAGNGSERAKALLRALKFAD